MDEKAPPKIGKCPGCQKGARLMGNGACCECQKFGPNYGELAARIRSDVGFARKCYEMLTKDHTKEEFARMFGYTAEELGEAAAVG